MGAILVVLRVVALIVLLAKFALLTGLAIIAAASTFALTKMGPAPSEVPDPQNFTSTFYL